MASWQPPPRKCLRQHRKRRGQCRAMGASLVAQCVRAPPPPLVVRFLMRTFAVRPLRRRLAFPGSTTLLESYCYREGVRGADKIYSRC